MCCLLMIVVSLKSEIGMQSSRAVLQKGVSRKLTPRKQPPKNCLYNKQPPRHFSSRKFLRRNCPPAINPPSSCTHRILLHTPLPPLDMLPTNDLWKLTPWQLPWKITSNKLFNFLLHSNYELDEFKWNNQMMFTRKTKFEPVWYRANI